MKQLWNRIQFWLEHHLFIRHLKVVKTAYVGPAYDWEYLLRLEQSKLKEMKSYFISTSHIFDHENDIKWINICIKLIDVILEEDIESFDNVPYVNIRNMRRFYRLGKGVTWDKVEGYVKKWPNDLRVLKAKNLYYEIRKEYTRRWWD